jgi:transposase
MNAHNTNRPSKDDPRQAMLFALPEERPATERPIGGGRPRLRCANRRQIEFRALALDDLLPEGHQARIVWQYVSGLDLAPLLKLIAAVEGHAGRSPSDPRILLALWLYATLRGVGSARQLDELCKNHVAYEWICGGVSMNHHTLADFRTAHVEFLDELLTKSVATLLKEDLVSLDRVAQDGMKVRASAGAASFRRKKTLKECLAEAEEQVKALRAELEADPAAASKRQQAARERAARERIERIKRALEQMPEVEDKKKSGEKEKARVSTTDAEARVMKMADGGFRPAFNVQLATDTREAI